MNRRMSLHPLRGSAFICLTLLALADSDAVRCDVPAEVSEDTGSLLLQLRSQRAGISEPVQELPEDEATSTKLFCRFDDYLPYWSAIGERFGDYAISCSNDFLCEKMQVAAQERCGFEIKEAKCVAGVLNKDHKGIMDARNGTELMRACGFESLGPGKVFMQSCLKKAKYMTKGSCESRCDTWDECTGYMVGDRGRECFVTGRVKGDCPAGYSPVGYQGNSLAGDDSESFAKIQSCFSQATEGNFLFFGHSFACEDFEDYKAKEDTAAAAAEALRFQREAAAGAFCSLGGLLGYATGGVPVCCGADCGSCGGEGCNHRPGGSEQCCSGTIVEAQRLCNSPADTGCVVPQ